MVAASKQADDWYAHCLSGRHLYILCPYGSFDFIGMSLHVLLSKLAIDLLSSTIAHIHHFCGFLHRVVLICDKIDELILHLLGYNSSLLHLIESAKRVRRAHSLKLLWLGPNLLKNFLFHHVVRRSIKYWKLHHACTLKLKYIVILHVLLLRHRNGQCSFWWSNSLQPKHIRFQGRSIIFRIIHLKFIFIFRVHFFLTYFASTFTKLKYYANE